MPTLSYNKRANFDYEISETYEAGIMLYGHEVKSIKTGHVSLKGAFVTVKRSGSRLPTMFLTNAHIPAYRHAGKLSDYDPDRPRQILLNKKEIKYLMGKTHEQGLTLVPIKIYTKHSLIKLEFGIGRGKKKYDKREDIKKKDIERHINVLRKRKR
jgi:SsrA-binding protein